MYIAINSAEAIKKSYKYHYFSEFAPTDNTDNYEKHVILFHEEKLVYPSLADLSCNNLNLVV